MISPNRFLVVVRAGDESLHPQWTNHLGTRNWDLVVSYFGDDPDRYRNDGEKRVDCKGLKWAGLYDLFTRDEIWWRQYEYIWLPDDDLAVDQETVAKLFRIASKMGLPLVQPALSWSSYYTHPVTIRHPSFLVRITDFVEVMAPCFERSFLEACLPTFQESQSGWGLDWLWPRLMPGGARRCAVIDAVEMTHTRPNGGPLYTKLRQMGIDPRTEMRALMRKFSIPDDVQAQTFGAIDGRGNVLDRSRLADATILKEQVERDWTTFREARGDQSASGSALRRPIPPAVQNTMDAGNARSTR